MMDHGPGRAANYGAKPVLLVGDLMLIPTALWATDSLDGSEGSLTTEARLLFLAAREPCKRTRGGSRRYSFTQITF